MNEIKGFLTVMGVGATFLTSLAQFAPPLPFGADKPINRIEKAVTGELVTPEVRKEVPILDDSSRVKDDVLKSDRIGDAVEVRREKLSSAMTHLEQQCQSVDNRAMSFVEMDKTIQTARHVNALMIEDLKEVFRINEGDLKIALANYKAALEVAPIRYRELAAESYRIAKDETDKKSREWYEENARTNENFAVLAEKRHTLFFGPGTDAVANVITRNVETYQSLYKLHTVWKRTLDNWPSTLDNPALGGYLSGIENHMEQIRRFTDAMKRFNDALEKDEPTPQENPNPQPEPQPEMEPQTKRAAFQVRTVSVQSKTKRRQGTNTSPPQAVAPAPQVIAPASAPSYDRHQYYELVNGQWVLREMLIPAGQP